MDMCQWPTEKRLGGLTTCRVLLNHYHSTLESLSSINKILKIACYKMGFELLILNKEDTIQNNLNGLWWLPVHWMQIWMGLFSVGYLLSNYNIVSELERRQNWDATGVIGFLSDFWILIKVYVYVCIQNYKLYISIEQHK